jgi:hypothetical protein
MADISNFTPLFVAQWERPDAENPRLAAEVSATGTVFTFTKPLYYGDNSTVPTTEDFIMSIKKKSTGYTEQIRVNSGELAADGLSVTLASVNQRGLKLATSAAGGIDLSVGVSGNRVLLEQDSEVRIGIHPFEIAQVYQALSGTIGSAIKHSSREAFNNGIPAAMPVYADAATGEAAVSSPVSGDQFYATTEGVIRQYIGGAWADAATGSTPNMSETVAGKGEISTSAERGNGTSVGGTGARLLVSNDALVKTSSGAGDENKIAVLDSAGSFAAGFMPSNLQAAASTGSTDITGTELETLSDGSNADSLHVHAYNERVGSFVSSVTVSNTTTETDLINVTVPANALGTSNAIAITLPLPTFNFVSLVHAITLRIKYGSTTIASTTLTNNSGGNINTSGHMTAYLFADGSTSAQDGGFIVSTSGNGVVNSGADSVNGAASGTATEDSTGALTLSVTAQWDNANSSNNITVRGGYATLQQT